MSDANADKGRQSALISAYAGALFDLDGVVYLGPEPVPGAVEGIAELKARDVMLGYVTNNAARTPQAVADHLCELGIEVDDDAVVTSSQAGARALRERFGAGARILAIGGDGVLTALRDEGMTAVRSADDEPVAVMQGWSPDLTWNQLNETAIAIQRGAFWLATNTDTTRPTDRGIVPGNGAAVQAVRTAVSVDPEVVGKPFRPLIDEALRRLGTQKLIFVGDRIDTDIAGAVEVGLDSLLVLSGAHGPEDLVTAPEKARPTQVGFDLRALLDPVRQVTGDDESAVCGDITIRVVDGRLESDETPKDDDQYLDALWATAWLAWRAADLDRQLDPTPVLEALQALR